MASSSVWTWKEEPESPLVHSEQDSWYSESDNAVAVDEDKVTRAEHASKLLKDLDQWVKEEDPFPDWLEEKIDLPIFDDLPPPPPLINHLDMVGLKPTASSVNTSMVISSTPLNNSGLDITGMKSPPVVNNTGIEIIGMKTLPQSNLSINNMTYQVTSPPSPPGIEVDQTILMEGFDYNLGTHDTLTPPESPREAELVFTMLQEMQPHELDELVRIRVESLVESPSVESPGSAMPEEIESVSSPSSDSGYSDPEWVLPSTSELKAPKRRRVTKPYSRTPPEEKKIRKKEQNKNAATRYRMKKKQEIEEILGEEKQLQDENDLLRSELTDVQREIKYLKNLMREMFKAKGLIK